MKLYGYYRSSAAYRVRIALNLKGLEYEYAAVNLAKDEAGGDEYRRINPQAIVPALEDDGAIIPQSMAICEYLEERFPTPAILPRDPVGRARVRAIALNIACEIHPLANRRTQLYLGEQLKLGENEIGQWCRHWIGLSFAAIEEMLKSSSATGRFCHGQAPTMADIFLVPQVFNAARVKLDLAPYPVIRRINQECLTLEAFAAAHPARQPDAVKG
ncbi:MAG TPA: maleylacetoacetate isomerase [Candidatus Binataceae bacterium]|nr:maleylacetoacetate isomerase [Candidatus Binataceae bacterium]